jgi:hypothetical protein
VEIEVEIFLASGVCHCSTETFRKQMKEISKRIEEKYGVSVDVSYWPVHARRARELDIWMANTVAINGKEALKGQYTASDIESKIVEVIRSKGE